MFYRNGNSFIFYFSVTALEPRLLTRWDVRKYTRNAYDAGVRYLGGCCGFESYHIREISEEVITKFTLIIGDYVDSETLQKSDNSLSVIYYMYVIAFFVFTKKLSYHATYMNVA